MTRHSPAALLGALLVVVVLHPITARGEAETPTLSRDIPDPSQCRVQPRPLAFFEGLASTPGTGEASSPEATATTTPLTPPTEGRVSEATLAAVTATIRELVACRNANDLLRTDALYTDAFFHAQIAVSGPPNLEFLTERATPVPIDEQMWAAIEAIRGVRFLPDGRVSAIVDLHLPSEDVTFALVFAPVGDRWLVDGETVLSRSGTGD
jgi:hypothetical protein